MGPPSAEAVRGSLEAAQPRPFDVPVKSCNSYTPVTLGRRGEFMRAIVGVICAMSLAALAACAGAYVAGDAGAQQPRPTVSGS